jgi:DNA-binding MarR family transcriptional regulator
VSVRAASRQLHRNRCIVFDVMALDLIVLGRQLAKIGESVLRGGSPPSTPTSVGLVLRDVLAHPGSSISDITARTGMPQSHVSDTVAQLVERGLLESTRDPADKRRTLVQAAQSHPRNVARAGMRSVDAALVEALGGMPADAARELIATLEDLASRLRSEHPGPPLDQLSPARDELSRATDP